MPPHILTNTNTEYYDINYGSMPNLLINRFMLNLRSYQNGVASSATVDGPFAENRLEIRYAQNRFLGNIGEPLDV